MKILGQIIGSMNKVEVRHLKLFMGRTNAAEERKDIELFDYIRNHGGQYDEKRIFEKLYGKGDKNAFYRLKNRLLEDIGKSIALQYADQNIFNEVLQPLVISKYFSEKGMHDVSLYYLIKAEKKAESADNPELIDTVYSRFLEEAISGAQVDPEEIIQKRKANNERLKAWRDIQEKLAIVLNKLKRTRNISSAEYKTIELLKKEIQHHSKRIGERRTVQIRFRLYELINTIWSQQRDDKNLERFLKETLKEFSEDNLFNRSNHEDKLTLIYRIGAVLIKSGKFQEAKEIAASLKNAMSEYGGYYHDKFLFQYYHLLFKAVESNTEKAIDVLQEAGSHAVLKKSPLFIAYYYQKLSVLQYRNGNVNTALKAILKFRAQENYAALNPERQMRAELLQLMLSFKKSDKKRILQQTNEISEKFQPLFKNGSFNREREVMLLIKEFISSPATPAFQKKVKGFVSQPAKIDEWISYSDWVLQNIKN
ncbi:MAG: hypothetical protein Fur0041_13660 [Bacteroidia bacterium]